MRSPKSEAILKRLKSLLPAPPQIPQPRPTPRELGKLQNDLKGIHDAVGSSNYALATASFFARDGKYSTTRVKRRYAID